MTEVCSKLISGFLIGSAMLLVSIPLFAQSAKSRPSRTIFRDAGGNLISNDEFVDLRIANPRDRKDPATKTVLPDGTIEFQLGPVPQEGTVAPIFNAPTLDGKMLTADHLRGKVLVLNFWFIGCPGCLTEMPKLNALVSKYQNDPNIVFLAIAPDSPDALRQFLSRERFDYQMIGGGRTLVNLFAFAGFPRNIVIGKDGKIAYWRSSVYAWDKFDAVIKTELEKN